MLVLNKLTPTRLQKNFLHIFGVDKNINSEGLNLADTKLLAVFMITEKY